MVSCYSCKRVQERGAGKTGQDVKKADRNYIFS